MYCLDARSGKKIWQFRAAIDNRRLISQGRLASRWPCRSGVLVRDGIVYTIAGMWPSEGVFVYALDAATGREVWCNDTSSYDYLEHPHAPSASFGGPAPQGYLLASKDALIVPTGRSAPATFDLKTGRLVHFTADPGNRGGTHALLALDSIFVSAVAWQPDQSVRMGESTPHRADSIAAFSLRTGKEIWAFSKSVRELTDLTKQSRWRGEISQGIFGRQRVLFSGKRFFTMGDEKADAFELTSDKDVRRLWSVDSKCVYSEALTANALLLGGAESITALDVSDGKTIWQAKVDGQVRGLAVSDGRVVASSNKGALYCFSAQAGASAIHVNERSDKQNALGSEPTSEITRVLAHIPDVKSGGYALVIGMPDTDFARALAQRTRLHVACVIADPEKARGEREKLISQTSLYGSRISVHPLDTKPDRKLLPFVSHFANLVVVAGNADGVGGAEAYRVLRPCGGVLCFASGTPPDALLAQAEIPNNEIQRREKEVFVVRGKLPGAFDWDSKNEADERVRWPIEFQWYGEPGPQLIQSRHTRPRSPISANGRMFVFGESHITAVDAYNGTQLWQRRLSRAVCGGTSFVSANDQSLFVNGGRYVAEFDALTGCLLKLFGSEDLRPVILDGTQPLTVAVRGKENSSGAITIDATGTAFKVLLTTHAAKRSVDDTWELAFDFRSPAQRLTAPGPGTCELVVNAWDATFRAHRTFEHPDFKIQRKKSEDAGTCEIELSLSWAEIEKWTGWRPRSIAMSADLKLWTEDFRQKVWARPLTDGKAAFLNEAEAIIVFAKDAETAKGATPIISPLFPAESVALNELSPIAKNKARMPLLLGRRMDDENNSDFKEGLRSAQESAAPVESTILKRAKGFEFLTRTQTFTGESAPREYTRSYGCSGTSSSATMDFFRSGTIGMYDRLDDSGMRNISGIRSGCGLTLLPSQGLLLYSESASDCLCSYSFNLSLAMAPASARRDEDWALFDDRNLTIGQVRQAAINFGAPGDRRDAEGVLWLSYPRPLIGISKRNTMQLPYQLETVAGFRPQHINVERRPIQGTDKQWIYGSQVKGITRFQMDMIYHQPQKLLITVPAGHPPKIDGVLNDTCWDGFGALPVREKNTSYYYRHDNDSLYVACEYRAVPDSTVKKVATAEKVAKADGPFERDRHMRVTFKNENGLKLATVAMTAGGARYDALLDLAAAVPLLETIVIDGKGGDWSTPAGPRGAKIVMPAGASARIAWNKNGLLIFAEIPKDFDVEASGMKGLTFLIAKPGSAASQQLTFDANSGVLQSNSWRDDRIAPAQIQSATASDEKMMYVEAQVNLESLDVKTEPNAMLGLFIRAFDPSHAFFKADRPAQWCFFSHRRDLSKADRVFNLRLSQDEKASVVETERRRGDSGYPFYDVLRTCRDDVSWNGEWTGMVKSDGDKFAGEFAIPWTTLESLGIRREGLQVELVRPDRWPGPQDAVIRQLEQTITSVRAVDSQPEKELFTVRLHFAELDDIKQGERVFDVVLQGKTVLKDFDIFKESGGRYYSIVREFSDVSVERQLDLRFIP